MKILPTTTEVQEEVFSRVKLMTSASMIENFLLLKSHKYTTFQVRIMMGIRTHMQKKFLPEQIHLIQTNHQLLARDFLHGIHFEGNASDMSGKQSKRITHW